MTFLEQPQLLYNRRFKLFCNILNMKVKTKGECLLETDQWVRKKKLIKVFEKEFCQ